MFGRRKLVDVKTDESPENWQWMFLLLPSGHMLCEAEIDDLSRLPESFRIRKIFDFEKSVNPKMVEAVAAIRAEAKAKFDEKQDDCARKIAFRRNMAGVGKQDIEKLQRNLAAEMAEFEKALVQEGNEKARSLPKLPPIDIPKMQSLVTVIETENFRIRAAHVIGWGPLDPEMAKRCDEKWAKRAQAEDPATPPEPEPEPDSRPMTPEMEAVAASGLASMASQMARRRPPEQS